MPPSPSTLWVAASSFFHVTEPPTEICTDAGLKVKFFATTVAEPEDVPPVEPPVEPPEVWGAGVTYERISSTTWSVSSNPNYEQFANRTVPFAGDYLWVTSMGDFSFGTWTDWRNTVAGEDQRELSADDKDNADVLQCRTQLPNGAFTGDTCPRDGGLDQDIYGDPTP